MKNMNFEQRTELIGNMYELRRIGKILDSGNAQEVEIVIKGKGLGWQPRVVLTCSPVLIDNLKDFLEKELNEMGKGIDRFEEVLVMIDECL